MEDATTHIKQGNKSNNLKILDQIQGKKFIVPNFISIGCGMQIEILAGCKKVAVRSDSLYEDLEEDSGAGKFETILNVSNTKNEIIAAYNKIQTHAKKTIGNPIGIIIQEMVENPEHAGVVFSRDIRSDDPNYFTINYTNGLGNKVVDGDHNTITKLIHKDYLPKELFEKKLINSLQQIMQHYKDDNIDVEFAYKNKEIYILQARRLTAVNNKKSYIENSTRKELIQNIENHYKNKFLGDMIDINAAELLGGSRSKLINSFFSYVFPENSLIEGRVDLGYSEEKNMAAIINNKFYIDVEKNIISFLPNTLNNKEKDIFKSYFKNLLIKNPEYQNQLDTIYYPISYKQTENIIKQINVDDKTEESILHKFMIFFQRLELSLKELSINYNLTEKKIIQTYFPGAKTIAEIHKFVPAKDIEELTETILSLAKEFTKHARGAFYFRDQDIQTGEYYKTNRYTNQLEKLSRILGKKITVELSNGFDILTIQKNTFTHKEDTKMEENKEYIATEKEILETARENIKYMLMIYITQLGKKIKDIPIKNISEANFRDILTHHQNMEILEGITRNKREDLAEILMPSSIYKENHPGIFKLSNDSGIYFPFDQKKIDGEIIFFEDIHSISYEETEKTAENKIILFTNATPEIDSYLPYLKKAKAIITKFGGPGAHIVLKIREMNASQSNKIGLVVGTGDIFDTLKKQSSIQIDFISEKLQ